MASTSRAAGGLLEEQILDAIRRGNPEGVTDTYVAQELGSGVSTEDRMSAINRLLGQMRLQLLQRDGKACYKEIKAEEAAKYKGLTAEEKLVLQVIKQASNTGLWTKDMRVRTNLAQPQITKILKVLESRVLIKSVKNVNNPSRKVYMLAELEPSRDLTGGAWYTENQFDSEFIDVLREACFRFIEHKGDTTLADITKFVKAKGFSKVDLRDEDINCIVMTLVYDGRVDQVEGEAEDDHDDHFRPVALAVPPTTAITSLPCGTCPVIAECHEGGIISPQTCVYYDKWLEF